VEARNLDVIPDVCAIRFLLVYITTLGILQGLLQMKTDTYKVPLKVIRLWRHECERVFRDRLVNQNDLEKYDEFLIATLKSVFKEEPLDQIQATPNLFTSFIDATADGAPLYNQVISLPHGRVKRVAAP
jgi:dynein heavy chain, axonemal